MKKSIKRRWIRALRRKNNPYKQGKDYLYNPKENAYCCLGVLCDIAVKDGIITRGKDGEFTDLNGAPLDNKILSYTVMDWAGLNTRLGKVENTEYLFSLVGPKSNARRTLSGMNDSGKSFNFIADIIEEYF